MESAQSSGKWKGIVIAVLALALLALLVWLFLRPGQQARDLVFGDLGRRPSASNALANGRAAAAPVPPGDVVSNGGQMTTNALARNEPVHVHDDESAGRIGSAPLAAQSSQGVAPGDSNSVPPGNGSPENSNSPYAPSSNHPPPASPPSATRASALSSHPKPAFLEDASPPEPANKDSTATLLAAAKEAGRGPDNPIPARTSDLLGNEGALARMFDAEAGSNVVFILANSLSMMTNGKSFSARQAVARTLESMNASQTFYILLFHSGGYEGMPALGPVPATPENVRSTTNWLFNVGHRSGADPTRAVQRALGLAPAPDTVWLLSDSEIPNQVVDNIREANASVNAHVNTIGFYSRAGEQGLRHVADENCGAYRFVPPPNTPAP